MESTASSRDDITALRIGFNPDDADVEAVAIDKALESFKRSIELVSSPGFGMSDVNFGQMSKILEMFMLTNENSAGRKTPTYVHCT